MRPALPITCLAVALFAGRADFAQTQQAEPASRAEVLQLFDTMDMAKQTKEMRARLVPLLTAQMVRDIRRNNPAASADEVEKQIEQVRSFVENMPLDKMNDALMNIYQRHFSSPEIQQLIAFYQTSVGQKLRRESAQIAAEYLQEVMPIAQEYARQAMDQLKTKSQPGH